MRVKPNRFEEKIERLRQYRDEGKRAEIIDAFEAYGVTERTLDEWLAEPNPNARYVKNGTFDKILQRLPDLKIAEHVRSYRLGLKERGLDEDTQRPLSKYNGLYELVTNIDPKVINLWSMRIHFSEDISFPVFKLRAKFLDEATGKSNMRICDGYVILDGQRLIFTGIGEYFTTFIIARVAVKPAKDPMHCSVTIEDKYSGYAYTSSGALKLESSAEKITRDFVGDYYMRI